MNESKPVDYTAYLEGSLKLSAYGEWWHNGAPFQNKKLSELFSRSVVWDQNEMRYFVQIGRQRATFTMEDTPYFITALENARVPWVVQVSDGTTEEFNPDRISVGAKNQLYYSVKEGHRARALRSVHQELLQYAVSDVELEINGIRIPLRKEE